VESSSFIADILVGLAEGRELTEAQLRGMLGAMMAGSCDEAAGGAFLTALRTKGETAAEIACGAQVLREYMLRWNPGRDDLLDTCGTGGDGAGTFNISTATALVAAAAGASVVKHGNRSASSRGGSADVLAALGIRIDGGEAFARRTLAATNFAFCFAPQFHPALKNVAGLRRRLGVPTIFNWLGPLANPAGAAYQLLGVARPELLDRMAEALARLGTKRALVLCSCDGLDEVSLSAATMVRDVCGTTITKHEWTAADFHLKSCTLEELFAPHPQASADTIKNVIEGGQGPAQRIVLANTAVALLAAERVMTLTEGVAAAQAAIDSGRARHVLETLQALSRSDFI
jgi:anthranilate phosphoribosyltransferase